MAKSKNHTANNQTCKAHRNGIHKPKRQRYPALVQVQLCVLIRYLICVALCLDECQIFKKQKKSLEIRP